MPRFAFGSRIRFVLVSLVGLVAAAVVGTAATACSSSADTPLAAGDAPNDAALLEGGEGGGLLADAAPADAAAPHAIDVRVDGGFVRRAWPIGTGLLGLIDAPVDIQVSFGRPVRELRWFDDRGVERRRFAPPLGKELLDVAAHPSGELTALFASDAGFELFRLDSEGAVLASTPANDDEVANDPPAYPPGAPAPKPIPGYTHDVGRVAAVGEDVVLAIRTDRGSTIVSRHAFDSGFVRKFRALASPAVDLTPVGLTGGSYDTFGQLEAQYAVHLAVDETGLAYVAIRHPEFGGKELREVHDQVFGEKLSSPDPDDLDVYVTRISPDGTRLGTSVVATEREDELYGLRAVAGSAYVLGRSESWNALGTGWNAMVARVDGQSGAVTTQEIDIDRGDVAFDVAVDSTGALVLVGGSGYTQNPHGASISEETNAFARVVRGQAIEAIASVPNGPRNSHVRTIAPLGGDRFVVGGMLDGPGTHSADGDRSLLRARGFLVTVGPR